MPPPPDDPSREDAATALKLLEGLLTEFPFTNAVSKSVALSSLIAPVVRGAFPVNPMHFCRAPVAGSGKSFLFDIAAAISIGRPMPVLSAGQKEEELEKRLGASAMTGQPLISIDNIDGELRSVSLCQLIERQIVDIRILGKTETARIETRGLSMFGTGNNVAICGDLTRRILIASLDPEMEQPETREFTANPVATVLADRGKYIAACLTICRAHMVARFPEKQAPLASFEGWSDVVRSALIWLGQADPVKSLDIGRDEDPERNALLELMTAWESAFGVGKDNARTIANVIKMATKTAKKAADTEQPDMLPETVEEKEKAAAEVAAQLLDALVTVCGKKTGKLDANALGYFLRDCKGRILAGKRFMSEKGKPAKWWLDDSPSSHQ
jgi:putative DNA primase/helicase